MDRFNRSHRLTVRTGGFQSPNRGSIPRGTAKLYIYETIKSSRLQTSGAEPQFDFGMLIF